MYAEATMQVVYATEEPPESYRQAIFLAGPTPRHADVSSWRPRALAVLRERGYQGVVFVPEARDSVWRHDYTDQVAWETMGLSRADVIVFWVPRDLETMPAFTTNIEYGMWCRSGKAVLGAPPDAPKLRFLQWWAQRLHIPQSSTLDETLDLALDLLGEGGLRRGGERDVPLMIWRRPEFQRWYVAQCGAGHVLHGARLMWHFSAGPREPFGLIV